MTKANANERTDERSKTLFFQSLRYNNSFMTRYQKNHAKFMKLFFFSSRRKKLTRYSIVKMRDRKKTCIVFLRQITLFQTKIVQKRNKPKKKKKTEDNMKSF